MESERGRTMGTTMSFDIAEPATIVLQVRPANSAGVLDSERLVMTVDGAPLEPASTITADYGGMLHVVKPGTGQLMVEYWATLTAPEVATAPAARSGSGALEWLEMIRPSRYCPSDHVGGVARSEFGRIETNRARAEAIARWIFERIEYVPGFTDVHDSGEHTLLTGKGVCRDFAHLGIMLCRALDIPARFASVYAPGLFPMDFHAVFEAWHDDGWWAYDATRLAPRQSLVRIGTGRDATDTSFASVTAGVANLYDINVTAYSSADLPLDDHAGQLPLA